MHFSSLRASFLYDQNCKCKQYLNYVYQLILYQVYPLLIRLKIVNDGVYGGVEDYR